MPNVCSILLSIDPMSRYLNTAQMVPIWGLLNRGSICCAVTMGQTLYVTELQLMWPYFNLVFMYDLDDSELRHENPHKRKITCSNRRPLELNKQMGDAQLIVPCPHTNTLYILEEPFNLNNNAVVHRVGLDGTVLSRWLLDLPRFAVNSMVLNPSGSYLAVTRDDQVNVYETVNGDLVFTKQMSDEDILNHKLFVTAMFQDDTIDSVVTVTSLEMDYHGDSFASNDHQCLLIVTNSNVRLFNKSMSKHRDIAIKQSTSKIFPSYWYDKDRGLVFGGHGSRMRVFRVTL